MLTKLASTTNTDRITTTQILGLILGLALLACFPVLLTYPFFIETIIGSILLLIFAHQQSGVANKGSLLDIAFWFPTALMLSAIVLRLLVYLSPETIDSSLDMGIGRHMMFLARHHLAWNLFFDLVYDSLPIAMAIVMALSSNPLRVARALITAAVLAVPLYVAFPAVGPGNLVDPMASRNCMPSLHLTWALLLIYYSHKRLRSVFLLFACLTAIATLTTGEHYVLDLVAAIPFSIICIWISSPAQDGSHSAAPLA